MKPTIDRDNADVDDPHLWGQHYPGCGHVLFDSARPWRWWMSALLGAVVGGLIVYMVWAAGVVLGWA